MVQSSPDATFFLPIMSLVVIEVSRIAREMDLREVAAQGHRPLFIASILLFPTKILQLAIGLIISFVRIEVEGLFALISSPARFSRGMINAQIKFLEFVAGKEPPEEVEEWLSRSNQSLLKYYEGRLQSLEDEIVGRIDSKEEELYLKIGDFESVLAPPMGRFALLHSANYAILAYLFVISFVHLVGQIRFISLILVSVLWLMLPVFEVDEYDYLLREGAIVESLANHIGTTLITIGVLFYSIPKGLRTIVGPRYEFLGGVMTIHPTYGTLPLIAGVFAVWWYLRILYKEMRNVEKLPMSVYAS